MRRRMYARPVVMSPRVRVDTAPCAKCATGFSPRVSQPTRDPSARPLSSLEFLKRSRAMATVTIGNRVVGDGEACFIIAEIGINHNGDLEIAKKLIGAAV